MDISTVNTYITGFSNSVGGVSGFLAKTIGWLFTFKNMVFFVIIGLIIFVIYFLYKQDTLAKRYAFNRNREV